MKPTAGVMAAALVLLAGSALGALLNIVGLIAMFVVSVVAPQPAFPHPLLIVALIGNAFVIGTEVFAIFTAIALLRLKNWARITTIVFAVFILFQAVIFTAFIFFLPIPPAPNLPPHFDVGFHATMTVFGLFFFAVGLWWLLLFTRRSVRTQFQSAPAATLASAPDALLSATPAPFAPSAVLAYSSPALPIPPRDSKPLRAPVVVIVVAVLLLAGTPSVLFAPLMHLPAFVLGKIFYGSAAYLVYFLLGAVNLIVGIGLLRLKSWSLPAAIAVYILGVLNSLSMVLPASRAAYLDAMTHFMPFATLPNAFPISPQFLAGIMDFGAAFGVLFAIALIVLLLRARSAFEQAARERAASPSAALR
jgi:hypothetical protein